MTVGIVGLGLIGGSVGLALRAPGRTIVGFDPSGGARDIALKRFCVDRVDSRDAVSRCEVVFVAVPPSSVVTTLEAVRGSMTEETVITDCTSVKGEIVAWTESVDIHNFVGGHPMAGHEKSSAAYASAWMFRGAKWILCPTVRTDDRAVVKVEHLVREMGAEPVRIPAELHDQQVAVLSHLPHALAATLLLLAKDFERTDLSGGSWKDLTRVGGADPELWSQIALGNRQELVAALMNTSDTLTRLAMALELGDSEAVRDFFRKAKLAKPNNPA